MANHTKELQIEKKKKVDSYKLMITQESRFA